MILVYKVEGKIINKEGNKTEGKFWAKDDKNNIKTFLFFAERDSSNHWYINSTFFEEKSHKEIRYFLPAAIVTELKNEIAKFLNENIKPKWKLDCNLQIGNGKISTHVRMNNEEVDMSNYSLNIKRKSNFKMVGASDLKFKHDVKISNTNNTKNMNKAILSKMWEFIKSIFKKEEKVKITGANVESGGRLDMRDKSSINVNVQKEKLRN